MASVLHELQDWGGGIYFDTQVLLLAAPQEFSHVQGCENHILISFNEDALELLLR